MDWKTFLSSLVASIAWPLAAVLIVSLLRDPLATLVPLLRKLKWRDLELDFAENLERAEREADAADLPPPQPVLIETAADDLTTRARRTFRQLATTAPRAAIAEAWRQLEWRMRDSLKRKGAAPPNTPLKLIQAAREQQLVPPQVLALLDDLRVLRNQAVHGQDQEIDPARAVEYLEIAERVALALPEGRPLGDPGLSSP